MPLTPDALSALSSPQQAEAALRALKDGAASDMTVGELAKVAGLNLPQSSDWSAWASALDDPAAGSVLFLLACVALVIGTLLWFIGDKALKAVGIVLFGLLGTALGAAAELFHSGVLSSTTLGAGLVGSLGGVCLGALALSMLSRSICTFTGAATGVLATILLASTSGLSTFSEPPSAIPTADSPTRVMRVAGPDAQDVQAQIDDLNRRLAELDRQRERDHRPEAAESEAATSPVQTVLSQIPSPWTALGAEEVPPATLMAGSALGGGAGLIASLLLGRWSRRLAAASMGAGLAVAGLAALLHHIDSATIPTAPMFAGGWLTLAFIRSLVPGKRAATADG